MIARAKAAGVHALVYDPLQHEWPHAAFVCDDIDQFIDVAFANSNCLLIIDEAADAIGAARSKDTSHRNRLATQSRHLGHRAIFVSQVYSGISKTIRAQCDKIWLFRQHRQELETVARAFARDDFKAAASELGRGQCLYIPMFGDIIPINVFDEKRVDNKQS